MLLVVLLSAACVPATPVVVEKEVVVTPTPVPPGVAIKLALELADKATRGEKANYEGKSGIAIGVIMPRLDNPGFQAIYIGALSKAIELDASVVTLDAHDSVDTELAMIDVLITRKVDAMVFVPVDSAALSTGVLRANEAGVPIVAMDRSTEAGELAALVESDNMAHGAKGADLMTEMARKLGLEISNLKCWSC